MIDEKDSEATAIQVRRLSAKRGWPSIVEGQMELVRIAKRYAPNLAELRSKISSICEESERCPDARELKLELQGKAEDYGKPPLWKGYAQ